MESISVAVDIAIFAQGKVLLVQRKNEPFQGKWALPGGFVDVDEDLQEAAKRELQEETGIETDLKQVRTFGKPKRDPRGRVVSVLYMGDLESAVEPSAASDAIEAKWFDLNELPELAFDHDGMVATAKRFQRK